jgi:NitT/TauT family transport system ATP-binding protein
VDFTKSQNHAVKADPSPRAAVAVTAAPATARSGAIEIAHVNHVFPGGMQAVKDASLSIPAGEFVSIVGPSGCGKTTLLNLLAGLLDVQEGAVSVAGAAPKAGRSDVAYMLARDCLFPWRTALENVALGGEFRGVPRETRRERAMEMLAKVGLRGFESHFPKALSHGMRQRVALARTFSLDSPVMLMDEPFGALDAQTKLLLQNSFAETISESGKTTLLITHDLGEAVLMSDRILVLSERPGTVVAELKIDLPHRNQPLKRRVMSEVNAYAAELFKHLKLEEKANQAA